MKYYRCKCGKCSAFGSDHPRDCEGCGDCGTTLEEHPDHHKALEPHKLKPFYNSTTGEKSHYRCAVCMRKVEIDAAKPDSPAD